MDKTVQPPVYHLPLGADFGASFVDGLFNRLNDDPAKIAATRIFVPTGRMRTALHNALRGKGAVLWPKIELISNLAVEPVLIAGLPEARPVLERQLTLAQLIGKLSDQTGALASQTARFALAASLDATLSELQRNQIPFSQIETLDLTAYAEHWAVSKDFLSLIVPFLEDEKPRDPAARLRHAIERQGAIWAAKPPKAPVIVAGSTGSRDDSLALMRIVSKLAEGAIVLPGWDSGLPGDIQELLAQDGAPADHPQSANCRTIKALDVGKPLEWSPNVSDPRQRLVSLALTPAPVTDRWLAKGPELLGQLNDSLKNIALIEAQTQAHEALSIAIALRNAAASNQKAVLVTPDRTLARRVAVELRRWDIVADDSAGQPLSQTPVGVYLRLIARLMGSDPNAVDALAVMKHPLAYLNHPDRGEHLLRLRTLETSVFRGGKPILNISAAVDWISEHQPDWADWWQVVSDWLVRASTTDATTLAGWVEAHIKLAESLSSGFNASPELWSAADGEAAHTALQGFIQISDAAGTMNKGDYGTFLLQGLAGQNIRQSVAADPRVSIWGTLEARNLSHDLVIIAGLNEGIWPAIPAPSPWFNRPMRRSIGLPAPEVEIGLSAHDFQQAFCQGQVILSRALRDGDAPTVASRWLLRIKNLLDGLGEHGKNALSEMRKRAAPVLATATSLDQPESRNDPTPRPAPQPPAAARPRKLPVTQIQNLIRDPYAVYARYVLRLRKLEPLGRVPDQLMRGTAFHEVVEAFAKSNKPKTDTHLRELTAEVLSQHAPDDLTLRLWASRMEQVTDWLTALEQDFASQGDTLIIEEERSLNFSDLNFRLTAKPDRVNQTKAGLQIIDYKTGATPTEGEVKSFDKQLPLTKMIFELGDHPDRGPVTQLTYVSLKGDLRDLDFDNIATDKTLENFRSLITAYSSTAPFTARTRPKKIKYASDYDQLSRYGEWDDAGGGS